MSPQSQDEGGLGWRASGLEGTLRGERYCGRGVGTGGLNAEEGLPERAPQCSLAPAAGRVERREQRMPPLNKIRAGGRIERIAPALRRSRWISAGPGEELARGGGDCVEGEVFSRAAGRLTPLIEEAAIAEGEELAGVDAEFATGLVDPVRGTFELGIDADGGFVENAVAGGVSELSAPFFVDEGGLESELGEDMAEGLAVLDLGLGFFAVFVAGGVVVVLGEAFVGDDAAIAVLTDTEDGRLRAEAAVGRVVEDIALEGARSFARGSRRL